MKNFFLMTVTALLLLSVVRANAAITLVSTTSIPNRQKIKVSGHIFCPLATVNKCVVRTYIDDAGNITGTISTQAVIPEGESDETDVVNEGYTEEPLYHTHLVNTLETEGSLEIEP